MLNRVILSWEEAKVGLDIAGSGGRALAFEMGAGPEGAAWEGTQAEWHD